MFPLTGGMCHTGYLREDRQSVSSVQINHPDLVKSQNSPKSGLMSYHQSGYLGGWEQPPPKGPSEGRSTAT